MSQLRLRALAALDVVLRVPCVFVIDAVLNADPSPAPGPGSGTWAEAAGRLSVRAGGELMLMLMLMLTRPRGDCL